MRKFLLTIFWFTNVGNVVQLLVMASATWIILSGAYTFSDLDLNAYLTRYVPWLLWAKTLIVWVYGDFGRWILTIPILVISPLKFVAGTIIGLWAYSAAKKIPTESANA